MSITAKLPGKTSFGVNIIQYSKIPLFSIVSSHYDVIAGRQKVETIQFFMRPQFMMIHSL